MVMYATKPTEVKTDQTETEPSGLKVIEFTYNQGDISQEFKDFITNNFVFDIQTNIEISVPIKVHQLVIYRD